MGDQTFGDQSGAAHAAAAPPSDATDLDAALAGLDDPLAAARQAVQGLTMPQLARMLFVGQPIPPLLGVVRQQLAEQRKRDQGLPLATLPDRGRALLERLARLERYVQLREEDEAAEEARRRAEEAATAAAAPAAAAGQHTPKSQSWLERVRRCSPPPLLAVPAGLACLCCAALGHCCGLCCADAPAAPACLLQATANQEESRQEQQPPQPPRPPPQFGPLAPPAPGSSRDFAGLGGDGPPPANVSLAGAEGAVVRASCAAPPHRPLPQPPPSSPATPLAARRAGAAVGPAAPDAAGHERRRRRAQAGRRRAAAAAHQAACQVRAVLQAAAAGQATQACQGAAAAQGSSVAVRQCSRCGGCLWGCPLAHPNLLPPSRLCPTVEGHGRGKLGVLQLSAEV